MDSINESIRLSGDVIGQGSYGMVVKGYTSDNKEYAVKYIHPLLVESSPKYARLLKEWIVHEAKVMKRLGKHPNIVQLKGLYNPPDKGTDYPPYLVTELCRKGNLRSFRKDPTTYDLLKVLHILLDVAVALEHMHACNTIHCDLTPQNILITEECNAKIGDFGCTKFFNGENFTDFAPNTAVYMGPEMNEANCSYNKKLDIYSFGCVMLYAITGKEGTSIKSWLEYVSLWPVLQALAEQCLQCDPQKRPTADEICHRLSIYITNIEKWLEYLSQWPLLEEFAKQCLQHDPRKEPAAGNRCRQLCRIMEQNFEAIASPICLLYTLEPLLCAHSFDDKCTCSKHEDDSLVTKVQNIGDISREDSLSFSSPLHESCHKKPSKLHDDEDADSNRRSSATRDSGGNMIKAIPKFGMKYLPLPIMFAIVTFLLVFCLPNSFQHIKQHPYVNGLSKYISTRNYLSAITHNNTHTTFDCCLVDDSSMVLKKQVINVQCSVFHYYSNSTTLMCDPMISATDSILNYNPIDECLNDKEMNVHHSHLATLNQSICFPQPPFLSTKHRMYQVADASISKQDANSSVALVQKNALSLRSPYTYSRFPESPFYYFIKQHIKNSFCDLPDQDATTTLSIYSPNITASAESNDDGNAFLFRKTSKNAQLLMFYPKLLMFYPKLQPPTIYFPKHITLPADDHLHPVFPHSQTMYYNMSRVSLFMGDGFYMPVKQTVLNVPVIALNLKHKQCFDEAYGVTQALQNNDTSYDKTSYREPENYTCVTMNFYTLSDFTLPFKASSITSLISVANPLQLQNNLMVNAVIVFKFLINHFPKFKTMCMILLYRLHHIYSFVPLYANMFIKWLVAMVMALEFTKNKLWWWVHCFTLYMDRSVHKLRTILIYYLKDSTYCNTGNQDSFNGWSMCDIHSSDTLKHQEVSFEPCNKKIKSIKTKVNAIVAPATLNEDATLITRTVEEISDFEMKHIDKWLFLYKFCSNVSRVLLPPSVLMFFEGKHKLISTNKVSFCESLGVHYCQQLLSTESTKVLPDIDEAESSRGYYAHAETPLHDHKCGYLFTQHVKVVSCQCYMQSCRMQVLSVISVIECLDHSLSVIYRYQISVSAVIVRHQVTQSKEYILLYCEFKAVSLQHKDDFVALTVFSVKRNVLQINMQQKRKGWFDATMSLFHSFPPTNCGDTSISNHDFCSNTLPNTIDHTKSCGDKAASTGKHYQAENQVSSGKHYNKSGSRNDKNYSTQQRYRGRSRRCKGNYKSCGDKAASTGKHYQAENQVSSGKHNKSDSRNGKNYSTQQRYRGRSRRRKGNSKSCGDKAASTGKHYQAENQVSSGKHYNKSDSRNDKNYSTQQRYHSRSRRRKGNSKSCGDKAASTGKHYQAENQVSSGKHNKSDGRYDGRDDKNYSIQRNKQRYHSRSRRRKGNSNRSAETYKAEVKDASWLRYILLVLLFFLIYWCLPDRLLSQLSTEHPNVIGSSLSHLPRIHNKGMCWLKTVTFCYSIYRPHFELPFMVASDTSTQVFYQRNYLNQAKQTELSILNTELFISLLLLDKIPRPAVPYKFHLLTAWSLDSLSNATKTVTSTAVPIICEERLQLFTLKVPSLDSKSVRMFDHLEGVTCLYDETMPDLFCSTPAFCSSCDGILAFCYNKRLQTTPLCVLHYHYNECYDDNSQNGRNSKCNINEEEYNFTQLRYRENWICHGTEGKGNKRKFHIIYVLFLLQLLAVGILIILFWLSFGYHTPIDGVTANKYLFKEMCTRNNIKRYKLTGWLIKRKINKTHAFSLLWNSNFSLYGNNSPHKLLNYYIYYELVTLDSIPRDNSGSGDEDTISPCIQESVVNIGRQGDILYSAHIIQTPAVYNRVDAFRPISIAHQSLEVENSQLVIGRATLFNTSGIQALPNEQNHEINGGHDVIMNFVNENFDVVIPPEQPDLSNNYNDNIEIDIDDVGDNEEFFIIDHFDSSKTYLRMVKPFPALMGPEGNTDTDFPHHEADDNLLNPVEENRRLNDNAWVLCGGLELRIPYEGEEHIAHEGSEFEHEVIEDRTLHASYQNSYSSHVTLEIESYYTYQSSMQDMLEVESAFEVFVEELQFDNQSNAHEVIEEEQFQLRDLEGGDFNA